MHIDGVFGAGLVKLLLKDLVDCSESSRVTLANKEREARCSSGLILVVGVGTHIRRRGDDNRGVAWNIAFHSAEERQPIRSVAVMSPPQFYIVHINLDLQIGISG